MDPKDDMKTDLLKSFHEQFATNQNHDQTLFIQFISAVLVVVVGYGIIYSGTTSQAQFYDVSRDADGDIQSYAVIHLLGTYAISQAVLVLLGSLIMNTGYTLRRDQKVVYNIRKHYLGDSLHTQIFGTKSFNPSGKKLIYNSFLPGFNLIFVSFIYFMQATLFVSIVVALRHMDNLTLNCWGWRFMYLFSVLPLLVSAKYVHHYYNKYKKNN